ncbi:MAG: MFS transporter [Dehalococcoidia bacterium]|nr:MFS transporter [Dehalococcoidia bacterium]
MGEKTPGVSYERRYHVLAVLMVGTIMGTLDGSIVNVILPSVTESFKVDISTVQWVPMIYLLIIGSLLLFFGRLGDIVGYKKVYLAGLAGFTIASALCGLSPSIHWLIFFRAVQGLAAGAMMSVPFAIITASFPHTERGKALGINALIVSLGLSLGPSLGGLITSTWGWRFVFFINVPIGIAAVIWTRRALPKMKGQPGRIDVMGAVAAFVFLFSFLLSVNRFQSAGLSYATGVILLVALASGIAFFRWEKRTAQPMLELSLFRNLTFSMANISSLLNFVSQYIMVFLTPFYLQMVLHYAPREVGLIMTAFPLAVMVTAPLCGSLSDRIGTKVLTCLGAAICALSLFFMSQLTASAGSADVIWRLVLFGLGTGVFQSPNYSAIMGSAPEARLGIASGIMATMRTVGMVLGVAVGGLAIYAFAPTSALGETLLSSSDAALLIPGLRYAYIVGAIATGLASVTSAITGKTSSGDL